MGRSRSRSPRKKSSRKRSRSRERKRRRHRDSSSESDSDHKRRRDKTSTGHRRKSRSRSRERHKHDRRKRSRSPNRQIRKKSSSPLSDKEKKDWEEETSKLTGAEKVRARLKRLLDQQEKKRQEEDQMVMERVLTVPSSAEIAKIDRESFHQQKFKSGMKSSAAKHGKKNSSMMSSLLAATTSSEQDHDNAIFGSEHISVSTTKSSVVQEEPMAVSVKELPSSEKQARWLQKLQKMRSKFPNPPILMDEPIQSSD